MTSLAVIIPSYNRAEHLSQTLHSIFASAGQEAPLVLVVDDGSTDDTARVVQNLRLEHPTLEYVHTINQGESRAINTGLDIVHTMPVQPEFVAIISSDDPVLEHYASTLLNFLRTHPEYDGVYPAWHIIDGTGQLLRPHHPGQVRHLELLRTCIYKIGPGAMLRWNKAKSYLRRSGDYTYCDDFLTWLHVTQHLKLHYLDQPLAQWRKHSMGLTSQNSLPKAKEFTQMIHAYVNSPAAAAIPEFVRQQARAAVRLQSAWILRGHPILASQYFRKAFNLAPLWTLYLTARFVACASLRSLVLVYYKFFR